MQGSKTDLVSTETYFLVKKKSDLFQCCRKTFVLSCSFQLQSTTDSSHSRPSISLQVWLGILLGCHATYLLLPTQCPEKTRAKPFKDCSCALYFPQQTWLNLQHTLWRLEKTWCTWLLEMQTTKRNDKKIYSSSWRS